MLRLLDHFVENKDHGRQYRYTADHTEDNTFRHNHAKVHTKGEAHEAECDKSGNRCDGTSDNGCDGSGDGMCHRTFLIPVESLLLLLIAMPQENGIIHRDTKL